MEGPFWRNFFVWIRGSTIGCQHRCLSQSSATLAFSIFCKGRRSHLRHAETLNLIFWLSKGTRFIPLIKLYTNLTDINKCSNNYYMITKEYKTMKLTEHYKILKGIFNASYSNIYTHRHRSPQYSSLCQYSKSEVITSDIWEIYTRSFQNFFKLYGHRRQYYTRTHKIVI